MSQNKTKKGKIEKDFTKKDKRDMPKYTGRRYPNCDEMVRASHNDFEWYNKNPQLAKDAASLAYSNVLGLPLNLRNTDGDNTYIPGIYGIRCMPTFGVSKDGSSNVNTVSRLIYSYVRHANSGSRNYEAPDLMTYLLAMSSVYAYHAELARLYGLFRVYNQRNRYYVKALIESLGYDYDDIVKHLPDLRYYINYFAVKCNAFATPKSMTIYDRHAWLPLHVYKDSDQDKAQLYTLSFNCYYKWTGTKYETGSALELVEAPTYNINVKATFDDIVNFGDELINALLSNEDVGIMSGDILKAFGNENIRTVLGIDESYATIPVYDEMVLSQIHNGTITTGVNLAGDSTIATGDLTQEDGILKWDPQMTPTGNYYVFDQVVDCGFNNPTPEFNMEATRFKTALGEQIDESGEGLGPFYSKIITCGTEIIVDARVYYLKDGVLERTNPFTWFILGTNFGGSQNKDQLLYSPYFDWVPIIYTEPSYNLQAPIPYGDLFNYAVISNDVLTKLHDTALWSLMEVPGMGKSI